MTAIKEIKAARQLLLGFIGVGWIGRNRMEILQAHGNTQVAVIAEPAQINAEAALLSAPKAKLVKAMENICSDPDINGVVIATPSALHAEQSLKALEAGKSVFCQKPLGRTAKEVKEVMEASKKADKLLQVDLSYRYTKAFEAVYNSVVNNEIGQIYSINLIFHNAYGPDKDWFYDIRQSGGGCVMDLGTHLIDMALCCLGFPEITQLSSHLFSKGEAMAPGAEKVEDYARVTMLTERGTSIAMECSWHVSAGQDAIIEATFFGTKGGLSIKNIDGSFYHFKAEKYTGTYTETLVLPPDDWQGRAGLVWAEQLNTGKGYDPITANEYIKTAEIIDRIYGR